VAQPGSDLANNTSTEQTRSFTVDLPPPPDTTPPQTTVTKAPAKKIKTKKKRVKVTIEFTASEAATFVCQVDGKAAAPCSSPLTVRLGLGNHTILVTAIDAAGNLDATPASVSLKVKKIRRGR
jgi:hypothetical protein